MINEFHILGFKGWIPPCEFYGNVSLCLDTICSDYTTLASKAFIGLKLHFEVIDLGQY